MEGTEKRMNRDVRAIQRLVHRRNGSDEMQALVLAIPILFWFLICTRRNRRIGRTVRIHGYVEIAAFLACCTGVEVGLFGDVGEVL